MILFGKDNTSLQIDFFTNDDYMRTICVQCAAVASMWRIPISSFDGLKPRLFEQKESCHEFTGGKEKNVLLFNNLKVIFDKFDHIPGWWIFEWSCQVRGYVNNTLKHFFVAT